MLRTAIALVAVALLGGCGNERTRPPDTRSPDEPVGTRIVRLRTAGVSFTAPVNWPDLKGLDPSMVAGLQNKRATIAVWRYPRSEPLPASRKALEEVQGLLVQRVKLKDASFVLDSALYPTRDDARSIELLGQQTIAGLPFKVRSAHVFSDSAEIVVDAFAPPEHFDRVDKSVFQPLLRSLKLFKPRAAATPTPMPSPAASPTP